MDAGRNARAERASARHLDRALPVVGGATRTVEFPIGHLLRALVPSRSMRDHAHRRGGRTPTTPRRAAAVAADMPEPTNGPYTRYDCPMTESTRPLARLRRFPGWAAWATLFALLVAWTTHTLEWPQVLAASLAFGLGAALVAIRRERAPTAQHLRALSMLV